MITGNKFDSEQRVLSEFEVIRRYFSNIGDSNPRNATSEAKSAIVLSGGDDCALLSLPENNRLAISIDTLVVDTHFPKNALADDIARRSLAVAVSDLAAMGARPVAFTLALTLPDLNTQWLQRFSEGLHESACFYGVPLIGGDTTKGPLTITIQVHGIVAENTELRRSGASPGDKIYVSGYLGDAAVALDIIQQRLIVADSPRHYFYNRFYRPTARVELGQALLPLASSAIDISDGLLADVGHIAESSEVLAKIYPQKIPLSKELNELVQNQTIDKNAVEYYALTGGDDYELCFTVAAEFQSELLTYAASMEVNITEIGEIVAGRGVECLNSAGEQLDYKVKGYQHF